MIEKEVSDLILNNDLFAQRKNLLKNYRSREKDTLSITFYEDLFKIIEESTVSDNQKISKAAWCLKVIGHIQDCFISAFNYMHEDYFYKGWCRLIECETSTEYLDRHFSDKNKDFGIEHIRFQVKEFQKVFPYKLFLSPSFVAKKVFCSICDQEITPLRYCGHEFGEIYDGKLCFRYYDDIEANHVLICPNPKHKYAVVFTETVFYNYGIIKYLIDHLKSPWDSWYCEETPLEENGTHYNIVFEKMFPQELLYYKPITDYKVSTDPKHSTFSYLYPLGSKVYFL
ncbi:SEC-C motif domain protein [Methanosarcina siciliae HI350]|uniref:SEC-C motif domain protein n=1 Tax=Methanosarcina siciliae HI350 TaxID=1434119 RepID=A0A0E3PDT1_9EURY|nr:hypothetical protein [Methanosarcina siciliae]AKB31897.1 SEC-C motif domain protein [Methanosarcina siciliae HI350]